MYLRRYVWPLRTNYRMLREPRDEDNTWRWCSSLNLYSHSYPGNKSGKIFHETCKLILNLRTKARAAHVNWSWDSKTCCSVTVLAVARHCPGGVPSPLGVGGSDAAQKWGKVGWSANENWLPKWKKWRALPWTIHKNNSAWIQHLNVKKRTSELLEENMGTYPYGLTVKRIS